MSDDNLLDVPECLSPRLAWMRANGVKTEYTPPRTAKYEATANGITTTASTEMEALSKLAAKLGVKMWDENFSTPTHL